ncbi:hypothetical protein AAY473_018722 [Plecturocebus cupreus]
MPVPHRVGPSRVRCACCETLSPQRFQLLFSLWGWDQPSPTVPYTPHREAPRWGTGKTAAPAKRVALATRVAPLPGISRSVGNKNSSETSASWVHDSSASASRVAGITGMRHHTQLIFAFLVAMRFCHLGQAGLELLTSSDPPASASQSAEIAGMSHHTWPSSLKSLSNLTTPPPQPHLLLLPASHLLFSIIQN